MINPLLELLNDLAGRGIRFNVEGNDLNCYAQKNSLTNEMRACIIKNKAQIINILSTYGDFRQALGPSDTRFDAILPGVDLEVEAALDPGILPSAALKKSADFPAAKSVFLTGASGFLGAYLLHDLIKTTEAHVYCLVRCGSESDGGEKIKANLFKYGLWSDDFASRIVPVPGDMAQPLLGVGPGTFNILCHAIDAVYHNGALVNFIYPYSYLKDSNVRGTAEVIRLACEVRRKPLHFISTIGIFAPTTNHRRKVLESEFPSNWQGLTYGYVQSKWVAEKIVTIAADRGLPVRIYRPGFVTGDSTSGISNADDFVSRVIKGCIQLGSVPDSDARVEMVPVDYVSKAIVHLSRQRKLRSRVFNVVNPHHISAGELGRIFGSLGYKMAVTSYTDWRAALLEDARTSSMNALYPLLTLFTEDPIREQMPVFDCRQTLEGLAGSQIVCPEIDAGLIATYLAYFRNSGFLAA